MTTKLSLSFVVFLIVAPAAHAQFTYTTDNGALTITQYHGTDPRADRLGAAGGAARAVTQGLGQAVSGQPQVLGGLIRAPNRG
jgi:hypothetical protein